MNCPTCGYIRGPEEPLQYLGDGRYRTCPDPYHFLKDDAIARLEARGITNPPLPPDAWMESEIMPCPECDADMEPTNQGDWTCEFCGLIY